MHESELYTSSYAKSGAHGSMALSFYALPNLTFFILPLLLSPLYNCIKTNEKSVEKERTLGS
jgi:hypothetical protein